MTLDEYNALRATFPWTERTIPTRQGGLVQVLDNRGQEVPLFTVTKFLSFITLKLLPNATAPAAPSTPNQDAS